VKVKPEFTLAHRTKGGAPTPEGRSKPRKPQQATEGGADLFVRLCAVHGLPTPIPEHRFHPSRKWRLDWAWVDWKVALEIDGGIWTRGAHGRGAGIARDQEKGNAACALGWRILRVEPKNFCVPSTFALIRQTLSHSVL